MSRMLEVGPIDAFVMHYSEDVLKPLCQRAGEKPRFRTMNAATTDRAKVTCESCLEWLHA